MTCPSRDQQISLADLAHIPVSGHNLTDKAANQRRIYEAQRSGLINVNVAIRLFAEMGHHPADAVIILRSLSNAARASHPEFNVAEFKKSLQSVPVNSSVQVEGHLAFETARQVAYWFAQTNPGYQFVTRLNADARGGSVVRLDPNVPRAQALALADATPSRKGRKRKGAQ